MSFYHLLIKQIWIVPHGVTTNINTQKVIYIVSCPWLGATNRKKGIQIKKKDKANNFAVV